MARYAANVIAEASRRLGQKFRPAASKAGRARNSTSDGSTYQKMLVERRAIFALSPLSVYSQINANSDVSGKDATMAPNAVERFEISEIATTKSAVIRTLSAR